MTFSDLEKARTVLALGERASLEEIKTHYRALVKKHHPDTGNSGDPEKIREVNAAYKVLLDYVSAYRFSFTEEDFYEQNPEERLRQQFMSDHHWGNG